MSRKAKATNSRPATRSRCARPGAAATAIRASAIPRSSPATSSADTTRPRRCGTTSAGRPNAPNQRARPREVRMAKHHSGGIAGLIAASLLIGLAFPVGARAADDIVIGAAVPITGPLSLSGRQYYDSLQMAQDDINAKGGINGRKLKIVFEDTQASNSTAVNAFVKIYQEHKPHFVFLSSY